MKLARFCPKFAPNMTKMNRLQFFLSHTLVLLVILFQIEPCSAQDGEDWRLFKPAKDSSQTRDVKRDELRPEHPGNIRVIQNSDIARLDSLKKVYPTKPNGYRVQIFFGKRDDARDKKVEFLKKYPEVGAYISYLAPNFRLRVGDFRTKIECENFKKEISSDFPASYIVKDKIEFFDFEKEAD